MQRTQKRTSSIGAENKAIVSSLLQWFCASARDLPWRRTRDPYAIWVSEIMLQQTQVKTVIPYWECWMKQLPTIQSLAQAPSEKIHKLWEGLGYYTRVRNMQKAAQVIVQEYGGKFPERYEDVLELPGIGRYTAGAICSIAFNQPQPIVDGNVIRVLARAFGIAGNPKEKEANALLWQIAEELVHTAAAVKLRSANRSQPAAAIPRCSFFNQALMELGALVCTPREPKCMGCPIRDQCVAHQQDRVAELPAPTLRAEPTRRHFVALVVERQGKLLVRQRPAGVVNAHLWEFPNFQVNSPEKQLARSIQPFKLSPRSAPICDFHHSITRYRNRLQAFHAELPEPLTGELGVWLGIADLQKLAFSSAHKRVLASLLAR